jgi:serine/threonine-protein kinase
VTKLPGDKETLERASTWSRQRLLAGKYRLGRLIGEGGMGVVYEAEHIGLGVRVAVKLLNPACAASERAVVRFRREARAAAAVKHENIVAVTDTDADEGVPFIVMEVLDGESLNAWIQRERVLTPEAAAGIAAQILAGLAAAHEHKVIHRDLKPGNIIMARERDGSVKVKIVDFGISKFLEDDVDVTATSSVVGTPRFMAPEQALGQRDIDQRADLYAVGELLYFMATGRLPFTSNSVEDLTEQIIEGEFPAPRTVRPEIGAELERVILTAMAKARDERYPDAGTMLEALRAAVPKLPARIIDAPHLPADGPTLAPAAEAPRAVTRPPSPTPAPPPRADRRWAVVALCGLALAGALGGFWIWRAVRGAAPVVAGAEIRFGLSRYLPVEDVEKTHKRFVEHLERQLGRPVRLVILDDYLDPARKLLDGELDVAALSAYNYVRARRQTPGLRLLATPVTSGGSSYEGVVLVRADSGLQSLGDLVGKRFCWVSYNSSSGYLYPRALFRHSGVDPDTAFAATVLTGDHLASMRALRDQACDGAAVFSGILFDAKSHGIPPETFRIVATTNRIPYDAYIMSPTAPEELVTRVRAAILALEPGSKLATEVLGGTSFLGFGAAKDEDWDSVRAIEKDLDVKK